MKAFIVDRYGNEDRVRIGEMPDPELRENDVLVQIYAAGVNLLDSKIRGGEFKRILPYRLPLILGNDVAGVVVRVDLACGDSRLAMRSMRGQIKIESALLRNSFR
jgi:NADPH:quinone reductase-like Zn-dependent oxidoreductase